MNDWWERLSNRDDPGNRGWKAAPTSQKIHRLKTTKLLLLSDQHFVGWVEPTKGFVGFRCTQLNLHVAGVIAKCETQQQQISEPSPKSFYFD